MFTSVHKKWVIFYIHYHAFPYIQYASKEEECVDTDTWLRSCKLAVLRCGRDGRKGSCPGAKLRSQLRGERHMEGWVSLLCTLHIYMAWPSLAKG